MATSYVLFMFISTLILMATRTNKLTRRTWQWVVYSKRKSTVFIYNTVTFWKQYVLELRAVVAAMLWKRLTWAVLRPLSLKHISHKKH